MKALTWHGKRDVRVDNHPDPTIEEPTDAIIQVTSSGPTENRLPNRASGRRRSRGFASSRSNSSASDMRR